MKENSYEMIPKSWIKDKNGMKVAWPKENGAKKVKNNEIFDDHCPM